GAPRRAAALLAGGTLLVGLGPALHLVGVAWDWTPGDVVVTRVVGAVLLVGGTAWAFWAQLVMRDAWRVGQDESEALELVTAGPFRRVRHPIYGGMAAIALGVTMLDPTYPGALGVLVLVAGAHVQALRVEEPHLRERHGLAYHEWARRTGRFLPPMR
ncbi:methyltransferase family protein, partial [Patulibacter sp. S7RM1-6]